MKSSLFRSILTIALIVFLCPKAEAQKAVEWQAHTLAALGSDSYWGGGIGVYSRTNGRMRVGLVASAGGLEGSFAFRTELLGSFHLSPYKRSGIAPYAGGGVAVILLEQETREYIVALLGLESRPGRSFGWFAELGLGGGARLSLGVRYRKRGARRQ